MKYYNKTNMEILSKYEKILMHAAKQDWKEFTSKKVDEQLFNIYLTTTGESLKGLGCPSCVLKSYKKIGELYFKSKEYYAKKELASTAKITTKKSSDK